MLHAVVRSSRDAFHFFGDVSPYNLQTLRQHVRQTTREEGAVHLRVEIDAADQETFLRYGRRWLPRLSSGGSIVEVAVRPHCEPRVANPAAA